LLPYRETTVRSARHARIGFDIFRRDKEPFALANRRRVSTPETMLSLSPNASSEAALGRLKCDLRSRHRTYWLILGNGRDEPVAIILATQELLFGPHLASLIELPAKQ